jgi:hypothetical protein
LSPEHLDSQTPQAYNEYDVRLLNLFHELNEEGMVKIIESADDLVKSGKYKKDYSHGMVQKDT